MLALSAATAAASEPSVVKAAVLGVVQGLTEFLPVSSSAHLYIVPTLLGWKYQGVAFDVALHWGTLLALLAAFWRDWVTLVRESLAGAPPARAEARTTWLKLVIASVPAAVVGVLLQKIVESRLRALALQAVLLITFGFLLWIVDRMRPAGRATRSPDWGACLLMGAAQSLALVPGVSRSGVTITAGRAAGLDRVSAARFSFLLATPITFGAGLLELRHLSSGLPLATLVTGVSVSAVVGLLAIQGLIRWLARAGFGVFFAYRLALGVFLLFTLTHS